jgi:hypothetical protein
MSVFYTGFLALGTGTTGSFVELTGTSYARQAVILLRTDRTITNSGTITFTAGATWVAATQYAIFAASTGGTAVLWWNLSLPKTIANTKSLVVPASHFNLTLTPSLMALFATNDVIGESPYGAIYAGQSIGYGISSSQGPIGPTGPTGPAGA